MKATRLLVFVLVVGMVFPALAQSPGGSVSSPQLERYMAAYQEYLRAKIRNTPDTAEKLKLYNQAYDEYLQSLRKGGAKPEIRETVSPASASAQSPVAIVTATTIATAAGVPPEPSPADVVPAAPAPDPVEAASPASSLTAPATPVASDSPEPAPAPAVDQTSSGAPDAFSPTQAPDESFLKFESDGLPDPASLTVTP